MTLTRQKELDSITKECTSFEELNRLQRVINLFVAELSDKTQSIWVISAKCDKIYKELMETKYGK